MDKDEMKYCYDAAESGEEQNASGLQQLMTAFETGEEMKDVSQHGNSNVVQHTEKSSVWTKLIKVGIVIVGAVYFAVLLKMVLFKYGFDPIFRDLNLIPFQFVSDYIKNGAAVSTLLKNVLGNLLIFLPAGIILPTVFKRLKFGQTILAVFGISLCFEVVQYVFLLGISDVDDLIMNTLGGLIGAAVYFFLLKAMGTRRKAEFAVFVILCAFGLASVGGLYYLGYGGEILPSNNEIINEELVAGLLDTASDIEGTDVTYNDDTLNLMTFVISDNEVEYSNDQRPEKVASSVKLSSETKYYYQENKSDFAPTGNIRKTTITYSELTKEEAISMIEDSKVSFANIWMDGNETADSIMFTYWNDENAPQ